MTYIRILFTLISCVPVHVHTSRRTVLLTKFTAEITT